MCCFRKDNFFVVVVVKRCDEISFIIIYGLKYLFYSSDRVNVVEVYGFCFLLFC